MSPNTQYAAVNTQPCQATSASPLSVQFASHALLLSTFLTHFLIPSSFRTNRHTNQITRYIPSILRIPDICARARAHTLARVFPFFICRAYLFLKYPHRRPLATRVVYGDQRRMYHVAAHSVRPFKTLLRICLTYRKVKWKCSPFSPYFEIFLNFFSTTPARMPKPANRSATTPQIRSRRANPHTEVRSVRLVVGSGGVRQSRRVPPVPFV